MATTQTPQLQAQPRQDVGTRSSRRLRKEGRLPGVIYGHGQEPLHVTFDAKDLADAYAHGAHLLEVKLPQGGDSCLIKQVQWDYLGEHIIHVDLTRVNLEEEVSVEVNVELQGEPAALEEEGAYLDQALTSIEVSCKARSIPEMLTLDISGLEVNGTMTAGDVPMPAGVTLVTPEDTAVVSIHVAQEEPEPEEAEAAADGAEPEVIGRDQEEEESESSSE